MAIRRIAVCFCLVLSLLLSSSPSMAAEQDNATEPECLKGTVVKVADSAISLKNTSFPDATLGKRDISVAIDKETTYYDGTKKVNRAALQPGNLVLVYCKLAGKDRKASLIRIIGGKK